MKTQHLLLPAAALALAVLQPAIAQDVDMQASLYLPPTNDTVVGGWEPFTKKVEERTEGRISIRIFAGGALLGARASSQGVRDGVVDMAYIPMNYQPAEFPYIGGMINEFAAVGNNTYVVTAATTELVMTDCAPCQEELKRAGNVYLGVSAAPGMVIMSGSKINELDDFQGMSIRSGGLLWDRFISGLGATPVNVPGNEQYEAMSRGVVGAVMHVPSSLISVSLIELTEAVVLTNLGLARSQNTFATNPDTWAKLSVEDREIFLEEALKANIDIAAKYDDSGRKALAMAEEQGIDVVEPWPELQQHIDNFVAESVDSGIKVSVAEHGIEDAAAWAEKLEALNQKWTAVWEETDGDLDAYKERFVEEIRAKVDLESYGL